MIALDAWAAVIDDGKILLTKRENSRSDVCPVSTLRMANPWPRPRCTKSWRKPVLKLSYYIWSALTSASTMGTAWPHTWLASPPASWADRCVSKSKKYWNRATAPSAWPACRSMRIPLKNFSRDSKSIPCATRQACPDQNSTPSTSPTKKTCWKWGRKRAPDIPLFHPLFSSGRPSSRSLLIPLQKSVHPPKGLII